MNFIPVNIKSKLKHKFADDKIFEEQKRVRQQEIDELNRVF